MPVFANPLGLLALLGIPAVLAIHFLQRKAKELPVSTLFLRLLRKICGWNRDLIAAKRRDPLESCPQQADSRMGL